MWPSIHSTRPWGQTRWDCQNTIIWTRTCSWAFIETVIVLSFSLIDCTAAETSLKLNTQGDGDKETTGLQLYSEMQKVPATRVVSAMMQMIYRRDRVTSKFASCNRYWVKVRCDVQEVRRLLNFVKVQSTTSLRFWVLAELVRVQLGHESYE